MDYSTAHKIMAAIHLRRDWNVTWWRITDTTMFVEITGVVTDSGDYPNYEEKSICHGQFVVDLDTMHTPMDLLNRVMTGLLSLATHEEREFLRVGPNWVAPFHPHTPLGRRNWSKHPKAALLPS